MKAVDFELYIIRPTLKRYGLWSLAAENLLIGTAIQESHCGRWVRQMNDGPALGIYQMEPVTYFDVLKNVVPRFVEKIGIPLQDFCSDPEILVYDAQYATLLARLQYARFTKPLPEANNLPAIAAYWKDHWNTSAGKGTIAEFLSNWNTFLCRCK
jgi:hypothetical protein